MAVDAQAQTPHTTVYQDAPQDAQALMDRMSAQAQHNNHTILQDAWLYSAPRDIYLARCARCGALAYAMHRTSVLSGTCMYLHCTAPQTSTATTNTNTAQAQRPRTPQARTPHHSVHARTHVRTALSMLTPPNDQDAWRIPRTLQHRPRHDAPLEHYARTDHIQRIATHTTACGIACAWRVLYLSSDLDASALDRARGAYWYPCGCIENA